MSGSRRTSAPEITGSSPTNRSLPFSGRKFLSSSIEIISNIRSREVLPEEALPEEGLNVNEMYVGSYRSDPSFSYSPLTKDIPAQLLGGVERQKSIGMPTHERKRKGIKADDLQENTLFEFDDEKSFKAVSEQDVSELDFDTEADTVKKTSNAADESGDSDEANVSSSLSKSAEVKASPRKSPRHVRSLSFQGEDEKKREIREIRKERSISYAPSSPKTIV